MTESRPLRAVLLAAGFATRLYPLTKTCAKPLLEVGGEPLLTRLVRQLDETGLVSDVVVVANQKFHDDFVRWKGALDLDLPLTLVNDGVTDDGANLGAIADLELALRDDRGEAAGYIVAAGDNLCEFSFAPLCERLLATSRGQLLLRRIPPPIPPKRYNEVTIDEASRVTSFREKPADPTTDLAAICVYAMPAKLPELVREYLDAGGHRDAPGYLMEWLVNRIPIEGHPLPGRWFDIGNAEQLAEARALLAGLAEGQQER